MKTLALLFLLTLSACGTMYNSGMSADQIKAAVADKSISVVCNRIIAPWGQVTTVVTNMDQRVIDTGGVSVSAKDGDCAVSMNNTKSAPAPKPVTP